MPSRPRSAEKRILQFNRAARNLLVLAAAAGFFAAACVVVQAYVLSDVVNRVFIRRQALADVFFFLGVLLALALVRAAVIWIGGVLAQRSASRLKGDLREKLTQHLSLLGPAYTQSERSGELVHTVVEGVEALDEYVTAYQPARWLAVIVPVFVLVVIFLLDPLTTPVLLFTGPILVLLLALIGSRAKRLTEQRFVELSWMSAFFLDMLQGLATLKMFGRSREQVGNIREISQKYGSTTLEVLRTAFQTSLVLEWGGTIATALVAVEVSLRLMAGALPFNRALAVLVITPEFFLPLRQLAIQYHAGTAGKAAAERIFTILDTTPPSPRAQAGRQAVPDRLDVRFDDVSFSYAGGGRPALQGFSLVIPAGQTVALVGATGAGKTTAAHLLLRFIEPDRGSITVAGAALETIDPAAWRSRVAWVPQLPHLFYGTVADNIRLGRSDASREAVIAAAQAAHAHEFIMRLPQGYDTQVGDRGARLSGGQQQRLAIARAFVKDAPLLLLDEATSYLDSASETAVQSALNRLMHGRTVLIITHRVELVSAADWVAVLDCGRVIELGAPRELLARGGPYRQLVALSEGGLL
jgi:ATP-binding cassette subfamily C protein CydD